MAIADRLNEITTHLENDWTNIEALGGSAEDRNIENIAQALDDVWENLPHTTGTGTNLSLNTKKGKAKVLENGNTSQYTTTGKQLFSYPYKDTSASPKDQNGVIWTDLGDGRLKVNGTPTGLSTFDFYSQTSPLTVKPNTTYTLGVISSNINLRFSFSEYDDNNTLVTTHDNITIKTFTTSATTTKLVGGIKRNANNTAINNVIVEPMLVEGSYTSETLPSFEIFTGGQPSPSPDFPQPINVVSGDNEVVVCGKNIFDLKGWLTSNNVTYTENNDGSISLSTTSELYLNAFEFPSGTVSLSGAITNDTTNNLRIELLNDNDELVGGIFANSPTIENKTASKLRINWGSGGNFTLKNIMLNTGATAQPYEPYTSTSHPVNLPVENLASLETTGTSIGGVSFTKENGVIHINGTTNSSSNFYFNNFRTKSGNAIFWIEVTGYTDKEIGNSSLILQVSDNGSSGWTALAECGFKSTATHQVSVTLDSSKYYRIRWYTENNTFTNATIKIQLEYGNKKNSFTPYGTTPIEMCDINNNRDKFIRNSGKNLFDMATWVNSGNNSNYYSYSNGVLSINSVDARTMSNFIESDRIYLPNGTYYLSNIGNAGIRVYNDDTDANVVSTNEFEVTLGYIYLKLVSSSVMTCQPMLNKGSTALPYEPYGNGDWYLEKQIAKTQVSLDNTVYDIGIYKGSTCQPPNKASSYNGIAYCSKSLIATTAEERVENRFYENPANFMFIGSSTDTAATLKEKFDGSDLYYVPATPTYTKITGTLEEQLESVWRTNTYDTQTNISQENNDLPLNLIVTALAQEGD